MRELVKSLQEAVKLMTEENVEVIQAAKALVQNVKDEAKKEIDLERNIRIQKAVIG